mmetsp:Transcript_26128/g.43562  ORF Transcript_26128/g.43562 Transcript_26128/m.43562 type:complete len:204 (+) Transcript_26128:468-1079(+)
MKPGNACLAQQGVYGSQSEFDRLTGCTWDHHGKVWSAAVWLKICRRTKSWTKSAHYLRHTFTHCFQSSTSARSLVTTMFTNCHTQPAYLGGRLPTHQPLHTKMMQKPPSEGKVGTRPKDSLIVLPGGTEALRKAVSAVSMFSRKKRQPPQVPQRAVVSHGQRHMGSGAQSETQCMSRAEPTDHRTRSARLEIGEACQRTSQSP